MQRFDIINLLIAKYGYNKYLEIGVEDGHSLHSVKCGLVHGVDPASNKATFKETSDDYFARIPKDYKYDIIFVDGLHVSDQVHRDIVNSLEHLSDNGIIVVHDCNPPSSWHARSYEEAKKNGCRQWNGDVWRAIVKARVRDDLEVYTVNTDWGCGLIRPLPVESDYEPLVINVEELDDPSVEEGKELDIFKLGYESFEQNRKEFLNLISVDDFKKRYL